MEPDSELTELRQRVSRLEAIVASLQSTSPNQPVSPPAAIVAPAATAVPPPLSPPPQVELPPELPSPPPFSPAPVRLRPEISSTVWIAGAGGVLFLLGAIYGLTLSIQRGWISPPVRVGLGVMTGLGLGVAAGRLMLNESRRLGVSLLIAGLGTFVFALYFGSARAQLYPASLGLAGAVVATLAAGGLASRVQSGGAMAVANILGFLAPLIFSTGRRAMAALMGYYVVMLLAQAVTYHLAQTGARWRLARWTGLVPIALIGSLAASSADASDRFIVLLLLLAAYAISLWVAWLPFHGERPGNPVSLTATVSVALTAALYAAWSELGWSKPWFALALLAQACVLVALIPAARRKLDDFSADTGLLLLGAVYLLLAVPVAADPRWLGLIWGAMALASALGARAALQAGRVDAEALWLAAAIAAVSASVRWMIVVDIGLSPGTLPLLNPDFVGAVLTAGAWTVLALTRTGTLRYGSAAAAQLILVNALAFEWMGRRPVTEWDTFSIATLLATLTYALAGIGQWYAGMHRAQTPLGRPLRIAGYVWLAVAALKLLLGDLAHASTEWKAVATLGIGALLIVAALLANRLRVRATTSSS
ncbi:MAG TPA: DUF2339 domain-containing protein [Opitutaceae bacterium]